MGFLAGVAVFFTVRSGFFQITGLGYIVRNTVGRLAPIPVAAKGHLMSPVPSSRCG
jgi:Na+/alanine symporter